MTENSGRILVIKHGALGDFILATGPVRAIRAHHKDDHLSLMTTTAYAGLARDLGIFDDVWIDHRPKFWQPGAWLELRARLNSGGYSRIYDLQTSGRSSFYYKLLSAPKPEWSGIAEGCSHPHGNPFRDDMHTIERQAEQLAEAGITDVPDADISALDGEIDGFELPARFGLLAPGGSAGRPGKRWPTAAYRDLTRYMSEQGVVPIILGAEAEAADCAEVARDIPMARNFCNRTSLGQIAALARKATFAVGNDTGPMHLIALAGCKTVVLFSTESNPDLCAPRGENVTILSSLMTAGIAFYDVLRATGLAANDGVSVKITGV